MKDVVVEYQELDGGFVQLVWGEHPLNDSTKNFDEHTYGNQYTNLDVLPNLEGHLEEI